MLCVFCRSPSAPSKSIEHTVPESLGNITHILPRGAVCDTCNNYFSRKVELPVLSHRSMRNMRAWNGIRSKAGKLPSLVATHLSSGFEVALSSDAGGDLYVTAIKGKTGNEILRHASKDDARGLHAFAVNFEIDPPQREMSRLLAKIALERCFSDLLKSKTSKTDLIFDQYFDNVRRWARYGDNFSTWPYHQRTIYPQETLMQHPQTKRLVKAGIGQGLFHTPSPETYYTISLYGTEFAINVGGPNIEGLERWFVQNNHASPYLTFSGLCLSIERNGGTTRPVLKAHRADRSPPGPQASAHD